jgi:hypothetical protein
MSGCCSAVVEVDDAVGEGFGGEKRNQKLETRSRKVEIRKWKLGSGIGKGDGEAE